jgi:CheY-like chemotaxis protein
MHFGHSGEDALGKLAGGVEADPDCHPAGHQYAGDGRARWPSEVKRRYPVLTVMMVTAYGDDERRRRAPELGAAEFLTKRVLTSKGKTSAITQCR